MKAQILDFTTLIIGVILAIGIQKTNNILILVGEKIILDSRKMSEFHTEESKMKTHVMGGLNVESRPQEMSNPSYNSENDLTVLEAQYREFV